jgi:hypothetical protein
MSSYTEYYANGFGIGLFHTPILSQGKDMFLYQEPVSGDNINESVSFGLANGSFFTSYPLNVPNTIFSSFRFKVNRGGNCLSFDFELNRLPEEPILKFTTVQIRLGNVARFFGYITKRPLDGEDGNLKFSGHGTVHRLEKRKIFNDEKYLISEIEESGSNMIITLTGASLGSIVGQKIVVREHIEDKNNGIFDVISNTSNTITVLNPSRVASTTVSGQAVILPTYWTDSILISEFLKQTLENNLNKSNVEYVASKIEETTGVVTAGASNFEGMEFSRFQRVIENILSNQYWFGVDGQNQFFLKKKPSGKIDTFFAGFNLPEGSIKIDEDVEGNAITIFRSGSKDGRRRGSVIAGTASDATSIAKYGESAYDEEIPAWLSNETGQLYAENWLEFMKNPSIKAEAKNMPYRWYEFGTYGYVTEAGNWNFDLLDFDSLTGWITGGDIEATLSNNTLVNGAFSHRLELSLDSIGQTHVKTGLNFLVAGGNSISFYLRSNTPVKIRVGFGVSWTDKTFDIAALGLNRFELIKIYIQGWGIRKIEEIGFEILECEATTTIFLDYMTINQFSNKHYELELDEVEYVFESHERKCNLKFGDTRRNPGFGEFVAGIKAQVELSKLMLRE